MTTQDIITRKAFWVVVAWLPFPNLQNTYNLLGDYQVLILLSLAVQKEVTHTYQVYDLAHNEFLVVQWLKPPIGLDSHWRLAEISLTFF